MKYSYTTKSNSICIEAYNSNDQTINQCEMNKLCESLSGLNDINSVFIESGKFNPPELSCDFMDALLKLSGLERLEISYCDIHSKAIHKIHSLIMNGLKHLKLYDNFICYCQIGEDAPSVCVCSTDYGFSLADLSSTLPSLNQLVELNLASNNLGKTYIQHIVKLLRLNNDIQILNIGNRMCDSFYHIDNNTFIDLINCLKNNELITHLDLSSLNISNEGAIAVADMLAFNKYLKSLILRHNKFSCDDIKHIMKSLRENTTLTTLNLSGLTITEKSSKYIAKMLRVNNSLTKLHCNACTICSGAANQIFDSLLVNESLTDLSMCYNNLKPECANNITNMLRNNRTLVALNIRENAFDFDSFTKIAQAVVTNYSLKSLQFLCDNLLTTNQIMDIVTILRDNYSLTSLDPMLIPDESAKKIMNEIVKRNNDIEYEKRFANVKPIQH